MKTKNKLILATIFAILAAGFYAINVPFSKLLLKVIQPTFMAAFLYLGAGMGVGILYIFRFRKESQEERLTAKDFPYAFFMIVLDIMAPIFLMFGISMGTASNASLLGNFEIVATTLIALLVFQERVSHKLWAAIALITVSSIILSFVGSDSFRFSVGSLFVILATVCWGFENNCTRRISEKSTYEIVLLKGIFSGGSSLAIAFMLGEQPPELKYIVFSMLLGFIAYGLSIFLYIRAQRDLGAAKTSAYYAIAPFIGVFLSFLITGESLTISYGIALFIMIIGTALVIADTLFATGK